VKLYETQEYNHIFWIIVPGNALLRMHQYIPASPVPDFSPDNGSGDGIANSNRSPVSECTGPE
jgi:hypothetical protein